MKKEIDWGLYISILFLVIGLMNARVDINNLKEELDQLKQTCNIEQIKE